MLFWNDRSNGKSIMKSSRVILDATVHVVEAMEAKKKELCPAPTNIRHPHAVSFPSNGGQVVAWEEAMSGRTVIGGSLIRGESFGFIGREQKKPFLVTNAKRKEVLVLWQEVVNGRQTNLFARSIKAVSHKCSSCSLPRRCVRDGRCVLPFKGNQVSPIIAWFDFLIMIWFLSAHYSLLYERYDISTVIIQSCCKH